LQAYSVSLTTHQADVAIHIQASLSLTPISSMHFFLGPNYYIFAKFLFWNSLFNILYGGNLLPFRVIHSMTVTCNFSQPVVFIATLFPLWNLRYPYNCEAY
jgi:hypothetical protein